MRELSILWFHSISPIIFASPEIKKIMDGSTKFFPVNCIHRISFKIYEVVIMSVTCNYRPLVLSLSHSLLSHILSVCLYWWKNTYITLYGVKIRVTRTDQITRRAGDIRSSLGSGKIELSFHAAEAMNFYRIFEWTVSPTSI